MQVTHLLSPTDILWKTLEEYGFNAEIIFLKEGITREMILKPGTRIPHAKAENLWSRVAGLIEDPCFGLHAAKFWILPTLMHWVMPGLPAAPYAKHSIVPLVTHSLLGATGKLE